jgi:hypothetical protein
MTPNRKYILEQLETDHAFRSRLVEHIRCAASILRGESGFDIASDQYVGAKIAPELLELAQYLCDHVRVSSDHRCRYCELLLAEAGG